MQNLCKPTSPGVERELQNGARQTSIFSIDERGQSEKGAINTYKILDLEPSPSWRIMFVAIETKPGDHQECCFYHQQFFRWKEED